MRFSTQSLVNYKAFWETKLIKAEKGYASYPRLRWWFGWQIVRAYRISQLIDAELKKNLF